MPKWDRPVEPLPACYLLFPAILGPKGHSRGPPAQKRRRAFYRYPYPIPERPSQALVRLPRPKTSRMGWPRRWREARQTECRIEYAGRQAYPTWPEEQPREGQRQQRSRSATTSDPSEDTSPQEVAVSGRERCEESGGPRRSATTSCCRTTRRSALSSTTE